MREMKIPAGEKQVLRYAQDDKQKQRQKREADSSAALRNDNTKKY